MSVNYQKQTDANAARSIKIPIWVDPLLDQPDQNGLHNRSESNKEYSARQKERFMLEGGEKEEEGGESKPAKKEREKGRTNLVATRFTWRPPLTHRKKRKTTTSTNSNSPDNDEEGRRPFLSSVVHGDEYFASRANLFLFDWSRCC